MRVALISGEFPPDQGGLGDYTRELAIEFARHDLDVHIITHMSTSRLPGKQIGTLKPVCPTYNVERARLRTWRGLLAVRKLVRDCDIVHIQYQAAAYGMTAPIHLLPRFLHLSEPSRPVVVTFHDLRIPYLFPKAGLLRARAIRYLARTSTAVITTNLEDLQTLSAELTKPGAGQTRKLCLIPIGSNIDAQQALSLSRAEVRASLGVAADEVLLCYFGFLNESKGGETLMRVLARVAQGGSKVKLLMLGGEVGTSDATNASYARRVRALTSELGLEPMVIWAGYRPPAEVSAFWAASDIALLPYVDGASLRRGTLMAALAHALPIVTTTPRVPIPSFHTGENILFAPPEDVEALASQVLELIKSPQLREQLSRGAAAAAQEFTWPRIAERHLELYHTLIVPGG